MTAYEAHHLANLFPLIEGRDFEEFCAGLKADGRLHDKIVLFEGKILDGRNRQRGCDAVGITAHYRTFNPEIEGDALTFVISKNLHRRHLTASQRAMLAADLGKLQWGGARSKSSFDDLTIDRRAEIASVGSASVERADEVKEHGTPELQDGVRQGRVAVSTAADIASLPGPEQTKVLALSDKEIIAKAKEIRDRRQAEKKVKRTEREQELGAKQTALPTKKYGVILADPEWRFEPYSRETGMDRAADNHYPTSETDVIASRPVGSIAAEDCVLLLWATAPMLPQALQVMAAWGFAYKSHVVWLKDRVGTGYWFRNQHELLLVGTRGNVPAPAMGTQQRSALAYDVGEHSAKPPFAHEIAEAYFPSLPKIELNARARRDGWDAWGLEAPERFDPETGEIIEDAPKASTSDEPSPEAGPQAQASHAGIGSGTPAGHEADSEGGSANAPATDPQRGEDDAARAARGSGPVEHGLEGQDMQNEAGASVPASPANHSVDVNEKVLPPVPAPGSPAPESEGIQAGASNNQGGPASDSDNSNSDLGNGAGAVPELAPAPNSLRPSDDELKIPAFLDRSSPDCSFKGQGE